MSNTFAVYPEINGNEYVVELDVDATFTKDEYEGHHLFYRGGWDINGLTIAADVPELDEQGQPTGKVLFRAGDSYERDLTDREHERLLADLNDRD